MTVKFMDEVLEYMIRSFNGDYIFEYSFDGDFHILDSDDNIAEIEAKIDGGVWITHAVIKDSDGVIIGELTDTVDESIYDDIEDGRYESQMENFLADDVLCDFFEHIDEED